MAELNEYEAKRQRRMEENRKMLLSLDIPHIPRPVKRPQKPKQKPTETVRRSPRVLEMEQKRTEEQRTATERRRRRRELMAKLKEEETRKLQMETRLRSEKHRRKVEQDKHEMRLLMLKQQKERAEMHWRQRERHMLEMQERMKLEQQERAEREAKRTLDREQRVELEREKLALLVRLEGIQKVEATLGAGKAGSLDEELAEKKRELQQQSEELASKQAAAKQEVVTERERVLQEVMRKHKPVVDLPPAYLLELSTAQSSAKRLPSSRLDIDFDAFHWRCLGRQLLPMGKQHVMQELCAERNEVAFSHVNMVEPWQNAVVLFVHVETAAAYSNMFREEQVGAQTLVYFQWLSQHGRHKLPPALVQRLQKVQRGDELLQFNDSYYAHGSDGESASGPLLLFLRHVEGPFIYCGRLGYLGHRPSLDALSFRWQLLDVDSFDWKRMHRVFTASGLTPPS